MSAPSIPNLNTLRTLRLSRGRGGSRGGKLSNVETGINARKGDQIVQQTDQDASALRMSAVELGYLNDSYANYFSAPSRKFPIINRGTYVRTSGIDRLVRQFLSTPYSGVKQIISFGAGSDTRYFRLADEGLAVKLVYHEIDFPVNCSQKIARIKQHPQLLQTIKKSQEHDENISFDEDDTALISTQYNIHPIDLRRFGRSSENIKDEAPFLRNLSNISPTLLISECCLCYLSPDETDEILLNFSRKIIPSETPLALVIYEPIRPNDSFGRMMISNLASRGIVLQTLERFSTLSRQRRRLKDCGFTTSQAGADIGFIWDNWISEDEKERVAGLEMMDELEEWHLLAKHYCIAWGWRDYKSEPTNAIFTGGWTDIISQAGDEEEDDDEK